MSDATPTYDELVALLKTVEWIYDPDSTYRFCGVCGNEESVGHTADCRLGRALLAEGETRVPRAHPEPGEEPRTA